VGVCQASRAPASSERKCCVFFLEAFPPRTSPRPPRSTQVPPKGEEGEKNGGGGRGKGMAGKKNGAFLSCVCVRLRNTRPRSWARYTREPGSGGRKKEEGKGRTFSPLPRDFLHFPGTPYAAMKGDGYPFKPGIDADTFETSAK